MSLDIACVSFDQLGLGSEITETLTELGYESPTPIQLRAVPILLDGGDLIGQAQTGTGKTAAFALPLLSNIDARKKVPQLLVLTPTRELAIQVSAAFETYAKRLSGFNVVSVYGGQSMSVQLQALKNGAHVVVGTPGRIMDHLRRKTLRLKDLQAVVLDEADEMLKMGFIEDIEWILEHTPRKKQVALFSATIPPAIRKIAQKYLTDAEEIKIKTKTATVASVEQRYWLAKGAERLDGLVRILEVEDRDATIIFARTKSATMEIADRLEACGYACAALNGDLNQGLRERTINRLKKGELDVVVATDVAARGLDVDRVSHVINYHIPRDVESYVHRIGRTGRAGRSGVAILFVSPRERRMLATIERATKQRIQEVQLPSKNEMAKRRIERFKSKVMVSVEKEDLTLFSQVVDELVSENGTSLRDIGSALCFLAQEGSPLIVKEQPVPSSKLKSKPKRERGSDRSRRRERPARAAKRGGERRQRGKRQDEFDMVSYRVEVGRKHGVNPGSLVAAIAERAGIEGRYIGKIKLHDNYSTVDLPDGMPKDVFHSLKKGYVSNRPMKMSRIG